MRTIPAGQFKARCLAIMDEVNATGEPVLITKRGKPVARVVPSEDRPRVAPDSESIFGFLRGLATIPDGVDIVSSPFTDEEWEIMSDERWPVIEKNDK
ncbi:MAG TPA: type II toxin-antitoxin system Phd/YefM family antitoxin [Terracidiphilus sp.]|jgi:prevent-host-death family protein|nr:type II toxin-antitoxin system Phd/YefM family antitoxin [Terracidiphilus sp.]